MLLSRTGIRVLFGVAIASLLAVEAVGAPGGGGGGGIWRSRLCCESGPGRQPRRHALHDALVVTDRTLLRGGVATVHVTVTGAFTLAHSEPVAGADVTLTLAANDKAKSKAQVLARATTAADGSAVLSFRVPRVPLGAHTLLVDTRSIDGAGHTERAVVVEDGVALHLRTDRAVYRPGQTVSWRVTALGKSEARPVTGDRVEVVVRDPRGTAIWRGEQRVPATGMLAGALPLGEDLLTGGYSVTAKLLDSETTERFTVKEIVLPAFEVTLAGDAAAARVRPGATLGGRVAARYRYGEPVHGTAVVRAEGHGEVASGALDEHGGLAFSWKAPAGPGSVLLTAEVVDGAKRRERVDRLVELGSRPPLRVVLVPERPELVPGEAQWLTAITVRGDDELAPARVVVDGGAGQRVAVASTGAARVRLRAPARGPWKLSARASGGGQVARAVARVELRERGAPALRAVEPVVAAGAPVVVSGTWRGARGPIIATLLRDGAPIASAVARVGSGGALEARLAPPAGAFGLATVRLIDIGWTRPEPAAASDPDSAWDSEAELGFELEDDPEHDHAIEHVNVYLRPAELALSITSETRYRPGQKAQVKVAVRDAAGHPVAAALAASVVDERALALGSPGPDLVTALRELDAVDDAASLGLTFADLLAAPPSPARDGALRAILEALPPEAIAPDLVIPAEVRWRAEVARIARLRTAVWPLLVAGGALGHADHYQTDLIDYLGKTSLAAADHTTPWGDPTSWSYAVDVDAGLGFARVAPAIAGERLEALADSLRDLDAAGELLHRRRTLGLQELVRRGAIAGSMTVDPWGQSLRVRRAGARGSAERGIDLVCAGADGTFDTGDDLRFRDVFGELGAYGLGLYGVGAGGGGTGWGTIGTGRYGTIGHGSGTGSGYASAPLRARFDETVLWRAGVPTGPDGTATLDVDLSDSITGWKVDVEALAPGAVGAATARLETFLPLHLDAELPPRLATGDRYRVPIAVANHSGRAQELSLAATVSGALRAEGAVSATLSLADGAAGVAYVTAVARSAGTGVVELVLRQGDRVVDRVRRTVTIDPPGDLVRTVRTGRVEDGRARFAFTIPAGAAAGSLRGQLRLFRGAADQAQDGLEGMLQEPYGCFEQTSSTTYPNLLVLRLLDDAPRMRAVRERARELVARGYQRLISYEVSGGGFSWFGESPANQVLTAYGLVEFADMAAVYPVDRDLIARTRTWLLSQQRPDGSWAPDKSWLHDWSQVQGAVSTTAYVAWALAESGGSGPELERALGFLRAHEDRLAEDPYIVALWAAAEGRLRARGRGRALALLRAGAKPDQAGGTAYHAGGKTIFYAAGAAADVQVTALAVTALDRDGARLEARAGLDWLWRARSPSYGWGTTQSTVLALRAAALAAPKPARAAGRLRVRLDGGDVGSIDLASVNVPGLELAKLSPGAHVVTVEGKVDGAQHDGASVRCTDDVDCRSISRRSEQDRRSRVDLDADLRISWRGAAAPRAAAAGLTVALDAPADPVAIGRTAALAVRVRNPGADAIAMPTVVVPVPPGFHADAASLRSLRAVRGVSKVEDHGDSLAIYLLDLDPKREVRLPYRLEAAAAVDVLQRPAQAYAYYTPDVRGQSAPRRLRSRSEEPVARR